MRTATTLRTALTAACVLTAIAQPARAQLLGETLPPQSLAFDTKASSPVLIYDHDYYGATQGRLVVLAIGSSLTGPGVNAGTTQLYLGDGLRDALFDLRINNDGSFVSGSVLVPRDPGYAAAGTDSWTMAGLFTAMGSNNALSGSGTSAVTVIDARWAAGSYDFTDLIPALAQSCSGGNCGQGGLIINAGNAQVPVSSGRVDFGVDWVRGTGVVDSYGNPVTTVANQLGAAFGNDPRNFVYGIAASAYANSNVSLDLFVTPIPEPFGLALMAGGLALIAPLARRRPR
jgi:hypothetical protein